MKDPQQTWSQWLRIGAQFYWDGTKQYAWNSQYAIRLLHKKLSGHTLTRPQSLHLVISRKDGLRLIPFSFFVLVPFLEFLLPFVLIYFPTLLPSTYEDEEHRGTRLAAIHKKRCTISKEIQTLKPSLESILHETMIKSEERLKILMRKGDGEDDGEEMNATSSSSSNKLTTVIEDDEFSEPWFDVMSSRQLYLLNSYTGRFALLGQWTPNRWLRANLRRRIKFIYSDDCLLRTWGVARLSPVEVRDACMDRSLPYDVNLLSDWVEKSSSDPTAETTTRLLFEAVKNVSDGIYTFHDDDEQEEDNKKKEKK